MKNLIFSYVLETVTRSNYYDFLFLSDPFQGGNEEADPQEDDHPRR